MRNTALKDTVLEKAQVRTITWKQKNQQKEVKQEMKKIADALGIALIKVMRYKASAEFIKEYTACLLLKT